MQRIELHLRSANLEADAAVNSAYVMSAVGSIAAVQNHISDPRMEDITKQLGQVQNQLSALNTRINTQFNRSHEIPHAYAAYIPPAVVPAYPAPNNASIETSTQLANLQRMVEKMANQITSQPLYEHGRPPFRGNNQMTQLISGRENSFDRQFTGFRQPKVTDNRQDS